jgi:hypothetical protein
VGQVEVDWRASYIRARDALYQFQYPPDPKMLREIADEIDCGADCEHGHTEWDTNAHACSRFDRGECTGEKAWCLRQFADAIDARAEIVDPLAPQAPAQGEVTGAMPKYGRMSFEELGRDVLEANMGRRLDFDFHGYNPGHAPLPSMNFNSLNRIVSKYAASSSLSVGEREQTGWLIELKGARPTWWSLTDAGDDAAGWVTDAGLALRFARKSDAEAYIQDMGWTEAVASEHVWSGA